MFFLRRKESLIDHALMSESEKEGFLAEVKGMQAGEIKTIVNTEFWARAMAEIARLQAQRQIRISESLTYATWVLALVTCVLAVITWLN
jgi:hypothetical protein